MYVIGRLMLLCYLWTNVVQLLSPDLSIDFLKMPI